MCTLAILPGDAGGYLLGHNRDESLRRAPGFPPRAGSHRGRSFLAPRDPQAGGSWIGVSDLGVTFALLNAAHAEPSRLPGDPPSRGRILDHVIAEGSAGHVEAALRGDPLLDRTKGFHLVMVSPGSAARPAGALRFRWDGLELQRDEHPLPALFVSSGFDQAAAEAARGRVWRALLDGKGMKDAAALRAFLATHEPERGVLSPCMHGGVAATVSSTIVTVTSGGARMEYHDGAPCDGAAREHALELPRG